jgi:hypothetical protein
MLTVWDHIELAYIITDITEQKSVATMIWYGLDEKALTASGGAQLPVFFHQQIRCVSWYPTAVVM